MKSLQFTYKGDFEQWEDDFVWFYDLLSQYNSKLSQDRSRVKTLWETVLIISYGYCDKDDKELILKHQQLAQNLIKIQALLKKYQQKTIHHAQCTFNFGDEVIQIPLNDFDFSHQLIDIIIQNLLNCDLNTLRINGEGVKREQYIEHVLQFCQKYYEDYSKQTKHPQLIALFTLFDWFEQRGFNFENQNKFMRFIWELTNKFDLLKTNGLEEWKGLLKIDGDENLKTGWWNDCRGVLKNYYSKCKEFNLYIVNNDRIITYQNNLV